MVSVPAALARHCLVPEGVTAPTPRSRHEGIRTGDLRFTTPRAPKPRPRWDSNRGPTSHYDTRSPRSSARVLDRRHLGVRICRPAGPGEPGAAEPEGYGAVHTVYLQRLAGATGEVWLGGDWWWCGGGGGRGGRVFWLGVSRTILGVLTDTVTNFHDWHLTWLNQLKHSAKVGQSL